jgi:nucleoside-diphosphate-sugar epimerase
VIGASGFVGRRVVEILSTADGLRPIAAARKRGAAQGAEWRLCDATDEASLIAALEGAAYAVNCVAGDAASMVAATRHLCQAARRSGLQRIVHLSSMAVYGRATGLIEESHALDGEGGSYAHAKVACEGLLRDFVRAGGDAVILRPGCIHGARSEQWTGRIGRLLRRHRIGDLGAAGDGLCNLVPVDDVAAAILAAIRKPGLAGEAFNLGDPDPGTWNDYFVRFGRAIGATPVRRVSARWLKLETKALAIPLKLGQIAAARTGLSRFVPDPIPGSLLALWQQDIQLDHRKADSRLGFPRTPPEQALANAAAWFRTRH